MGPVVLVRVMCTSVCCLRVLWYGCIALCLESLAIPCVCIQSSSPCHYLTQHMYLYIVRYAMMNVFIIRSRCVKGIGQSNQKEINYGRGFCINPALGRAVRAKKQNCPRVEIWPEMGVCIQCFIHRCVRWGTDMSTIVKNMIISNASCTPSLTKQ